MLISSEKEPGIMSLAEKPTQENLNVNSQNFLRKKNKMDYTERKRHQSGEEEGDIQAFEYICQYIK